MDMGLFGRKKGAGEGVPSGEDDRNPSYEQQLKKDFGLDYGEGGWGFEGGQIIDDMVAQLSDPDISLGVLKSLREKAPFNQVCIVVTDKMVILVCNMKPKPTCFVAGLDTSGVSSLIATSIAEGGKVTNYRGTWLLTL
jgi:hypothetical protein